MRIKVLIIGLAISLLSLIPVILPFSGILNVRIDAPVIRLYSSIIPEDSPLWDMTSPDWNLPDLPNPHPHSNAEGFSVINPYGAYFDSRYGNGSISKLVISINSDIEEYVFVDLVETGSRILSNFYFSLNHLIETNLETSKTYIIKAKFLANEGFKDSRWSNTIKFINYPSV